MSTHWRHLVAAYWNCSLNSKYHQHLCELSVHNKSSCSQPIEEVNRLKLKASMDRGQGRGQGQGRGRGRGPLSEDVLELDAQMKLGQPSLTMLSIMFSPWERLAFGFSQTWAVILWHQLFVHSAMTIGKSLCLMSLQSIYWTVFHCICTLGNNHFYTFVKCVATIQCSTVVSLKSFTIE